jgi:hypothetical protein
MTTPKLSTQKDALRNIIQTLTRLNKESAEVEKVTYNVKVDNGRTVTQIEIVSKQVV